MQSGPNRSLQAALSMPDRTLKFTLFENLGPKVDLLKIRTGCEGAASAMGGQRRGSGGAAVGSGITLRIPQDTL